MPRALLGRPRPLRRNLQPDPRRLNNSLVLPLYTAHMVFSVLSLRGRVASVGGVGSREAAVKPTWMYSRRPSAGVTRPRKNEKPKCKMYRGHEEPSNSSIGWRDCAKAARVEKRCQERNDSDARNDIAPGATRFNAGRAPHVPGPDALRDFPGALSSVLQRASPDAAFGQDTRRLRPVIEVMLRKGAPTASIGEQNVFYSPTLWITLWTGTSGAN
jgi:hypothetical protein